MTGNENQSHIRCQHQSNRTAFKAAYSIAFKI